MHEIRMPQMGQSVEEASIVMWLKKEGETVSQGEPIFTIQTDKAEIECESTADGVLHKILIEPDVTVPVLTVVALVGKPGEQLPDLGQYGKHAAAAPAQQPEAAPHASQPAAAASASQPAAAMSAPQAGLAVAISPRARAKARELGVDATQLSGTGAGGRVIETDVIAYSGRMGSVKASPVARRMAQNAGIDLASLIGSGPGGRIMKADLAAQPVPKAAAGAIERVPLTQMRKIIAKRMSESKFTAPHYYITVEIDMAAARDFRAGVTAYKLSYNDLVLRGVVKALTEFPGVNARWMGDAIEQVADVNLGIAVALPGGLIVPVMKQAQTLSLEQMATDGRVLIEKARNGKLLPDDFAGNTFTVSNLGPYGVDHFTAIINQPDSAIIAVGQMKDRPVVIDGGIYVRPIMKLTMSSDHRVIDGALAAQFMGRLKEIMETAEF
jgi:pyruvate dehydrogenase E2 component (dihydrolipoamide acetyltransferase)